MVHSFVEVATGRPKKRFKFPRRSADKKPMNEQNFDDRLAAYVAIAQEAINAHFARQLAGLTPDRLSIDTGGRKYIRVIKASGPAGTGQRMVHSFVEVATGNVLKAAGWKAPAKHARGNIWDDDGGASALVVTGGVRYLP